MSEVRTIPVAADEADLRLDRWFRRHFPDVTHARLQKWLRTGQVRVDGRRTKAGARLEAGQSVRVPPLGAETAPPAKAPRRATPAGAAVKRCQRSASAPCAPMTSHGSTTLPLDLDIFSPLPSRIRPRTMQFWYDDRPVISVDRASKL